MIDENVWNNVIEYIIRLKSKGCNIFYEGIKILVIRSDNVVVLCDPDEFPYEIAGRALFPSDFETINDFIDKVTVNCPCKNMEYYQ